MLLGDMQVLLWPRTALEPLTAGICRCRATNLKGTVREDTLKPEP